MTDYVAQQQGGTVIAGSGNDTVTGSANADVLYGRGGNDFINGSAGNDVIYGDGTITYAQALSSGGAALSSFTGSVSGPTGLLLTSMGLAANQSIWRVRNGSDTEKVVVVQSVSQGSGNSGGVSIVITIPAHSEIIIPSANTGTHKLFFDNKLVDTKASSNSTFNLNGVVAGTPDGDDVVNGGEGDDTIYGNGGNDTLNGEAGNDSLDGGIGNDTLRGGPGIDLIHGGEGDDTIFGDADGDKLYGDAGKDLVYGNEGDDLVDGGSGNDVLHGMDGDDFMDGSTGNDELHGGDGNDVMTGNFGTDQMYGESGDDIFLAEWDEGSGDYYNGGDGIDTYKIDGTVVENYALIIDLLTGTSQYHDTFISVENLIGGKNNDMFSGDDVDNSFWGRSGNDTLDGRNGNDKLYGEDGNDVIDGGDGEDLLDGGIGDDTLRGGVGNDTLIAGIGADTMVGGAGEDLVDYSASDTGVVVDLLTGAASGGFAAGDMLSSIENIMGTAFDDVLTGNGEANLLVGGAGKDILMGGAGADVLMGGDGLDLADYSTSNAGVYIDLNTGEARGGDAEGDVLSGIENLRGSIFDDVLIGSAETTLLDGNGGNDILDYSKSNAGIVVNLLTNYAAGGYAEGDLISNFEDLIGSAANDILNGTVARNVIDAGEGDDRVEAGDGNDMLMGQGGKDALHGEKGSDHLDGGAGDDGLVGGLGADELEGGVGRDTAVYKRSLSGVTVSLTTGLGHGGDAQGDTLNGIEALAGSSFDDLLTGDAGGNRLNGASGADKLYGLSGNDTFLTGSGYDHVDGGAGSDTVSYEDSWAGVKVNLATGLNQDAAASRDVLVSIENITGSKYADQLTGSDALNKLTGGAGNDVIRAGAGNDYIYEGLGNDTLSGEAGNDVFVFSGIFNNDTVTDFTAGLGRTDRVWLRGLDVKNMAELLSVATDTSAGVYINLADHGSITLKGLKVSQLAADDFLFG